MYVLPRGYATFFGLRVFNMKEVLIFCGKKCGKQGSTFFSAQPGLFLLSRYTVDSRR
jgi:hypothetical protein